MRNTVKLRYDFSKFNVAKSALYIHCKECMSEHDFNIANSLIKEMIAEIVKSERGFKS